MHGVEQPVPEHPANKDKLILFHRASLVFYQSPKGTCNYYISMLGGGAEGNAYFAEVVGGGGGSRGKMLIMLM